MYPSVKFSQFLRLLSFVVHGLYIKMYPSVFLGKHAKRLHNAYSYSCLSSMRGEGGGDFRWKGNTTVKFENKWRKAPRKFSRILFKGENTPFDDEGKLFFITQNTWFLPLLINPRGARGILPPLCMLLGGSLMVMALWKCWPKSEFNVKLITSVLTLYISI